MFASYKKMFISNVFRRSIRCFQHRKLCKKLILVALTTELKNRKRLTLDEWKKFRSKAKTLKIISNDKDILTAIKSLDNSRDPIQIAESFFQAFDIDRVTVNSTFIDLYVAKTFDGKLTQIEEEYLIKM